MPPTPQPGQRHEIFLPLPGGSEISMPFRYIPPGRFRMGSRGMGERDSLFRDEEPVHWVEITRGFWMAETPVTQAQFEVWKGSESFRVWHKENQEAKFAYYDKGPHRNAFEGRPDCPAEKLNWHEATACCEWMGNAALRLPAPIERVSLPTEAQWEWACRGPDDPEKGHLGQQCEFYSGDGEATLAKVGWYGEKYDIGSTREVRRLEANGWGLHDMHGNVWEWCRDVWNEAPFVMRADGCHDPVVNEEGTGKILWLRVLRGGSWTDPPQSCRSASRYCGSPAIRLSNQGFRPVLLLSALSGPAGPGPAEP